MNTPNHHPRAFSIGRPIGKGNTRPTDVKKLRPPLSELDYLQSPIKAAPRYTNMLANALGRFQDDYGLQPDGVITPDGPTEQALNFALATKRTGDPNAFDLARKAFAHLNGKGFKFVRDRRDFDAMGAWLNSDGKNASSSEISGALTTFPHRRDLISNPASMVLFGQTPGNVTPNSVPRPGPHQQLARKSPLGQPGNAVASSPTSQPKLGTQQAQAGQTQPPPRSQNQLPQKPGQPPNSAHYFDPIYRQILQLGAELGKSGPLPQAGRLLKHFIGGSAKTINLGQAEVRKMGPMKKLENTIRKHYVNLEFSGNTQGDPNYNTRLKSLKDGASFTYSSENNAAIKQKDLPGLYLGGDHDFALAIGRTQLKGKAKYTVTRRGNTIHIVGQIDFNWNEKYDFNKGGSESYLPRRLQKTQGAKPFDIRANWKQNFSGTVTIKNGVLSKPNITWTDISPPSSSSPP